MLRLVAKRYPVEAIQGAMGKVLAALHAVSASSTLSEQVSTAAGPVSCSMACHAACGSACRACKPCRLGAETPVSTSKFRESEDLIPRTSDAFVSFAELAKQV